VSLPSLSRARLVDAVIAVVGIACGGFALWMRHVGWAIAWPLSWVVALSAIVPAGVGVACAAFAGGHCVVLPGGNDLACVHLDFPGNALVPAPDHHSFSYRGIQQVAFSPDGGRIALLSDHEEGCAGSEGVSGCQFKLYTLRSDGSDLALVSDMSPEGSILVWLR
jgi:hypothetical protein